MLESEKEYECQNNRCRCRFKVKADIEQGGIMELPVFFSCMIFTFLDKMSFKWYFWEMQINDIQISRSISINRFKSIMLMSREV